MVDVTELLGLHMKKTIAILLTAASALLGGQVASADEEQIHVAPGMIVRAWGGVQSNLQAPNAPAGGGCVDLTDVMDTENISKRNESMASIMHSGGDFFALEWSGFMKVPAAGQYVLVVEATGSVAHSDVPTHTYVQINGKKVTEIKRERYKNKVTKTCELTLPAGFIPVSFFTVQQADPHGRTVLRAKLRPVDELDCDYLRVTDFFYKKKQSK